MSATLRSRPECYTERQRVALYVIRYRNASSFAGVKKVAHTGVHTPASARILPATSLLEEEKTPPKVKKARSPAWQKRSQTTVTHHPRPRVIYEILCYRAQWHAATALHSGVHVLFLHTNVRQSSQTQQAPPTWGIGDPWQREQEWKVNLFLLSGYVPALPQPTSA